MSKSLMDHSKTQYVIENESASLEQINAGSLQRIADACETMAADDQKLKSSYEYMKQSRDMWRERAETRARRISALKGVITKLKRRMQEKKSPANRESIGKSKAWLDFEDSFKQTFGIGKSSDA